PDADPRLVGNVGSVSSIRFSAAGDLAVFADRGWNQIILLQDLATTATPIQLATSVDGVADPVGIALLRDGRVAFVANAGAGTVTGAGLAGGAAKNFACIWGVNGMLPLIGYSLFVLTDRIDQPIMVFDGGSEEPRFLIFPPIPPKPADPDPVPAQ